MNSIACEDGPAGSPTEAVDCRLTARISSVSAMLVSAGSYRTASVADDWDAFSLSGTEDDGGT